MREKSPAAEFLEALILALAAKVVVELVFSLLKAERTA